ncbi:RNA polymerase subunit sigma-70, partial [Mediterraneibacter gnavus]
MRAFFTLFSVFSKGIDGISVYIFQIMRKGGETMDTSSFEHIVRIQF